MADLILVDLLWEMPSVLLPESKVGEVEKLEGGMHNLQVSGDILQVCSSAGFRKERERERARQRETQFSPLLQWRAAKKSPEQAQGVEIWIGLDNVESSLHYHNGMDEHVPNNSARPIAKGHGKSIDCKACAVVRVYIDAWPYSPLCLTTSRLLSQQSHVIFTISYIHSM